MATDGRCQGQLLWWVNEDQAKGPLGYGPSSADIETGRIISETHIYGAALTNTHEVLQTRFGQSMVTLSSTTSLMAHTFASG